MDVVDWIISRRIDCDRTVETFTSVFHVPFVEHWVVLFAATREIWCFGCADW